jgi:hypothetical protein
MILSIFIFNLLVVFYYLGFMYGYDDGYKDADDLNKKLFFYEKEEKEVESKT